MIMESLVGGFSGIITADGKIIPELKIIRVKNSYLMQIVK